MSEQTPIPNQGNDHILPESEFLPDWIEPTSNSLVPDETPITPSSLSRQARIIAIENNQVKMASPTGKEFTIPYQECTQQLVEQQIEGISNLKESLKKELTELEKVTGIKELSQIEKTNLGQLPIIKTIYLTGYEIALSLEPEVMNNPETTPAQKRKIVQETIQGMGETSIILEESRTQLSQLEAQQSLLLLVNKLLQPKLLRIFVPKISEELLPTVIEVIKNFRDADMIAFAARFEPEVLAQGLANVKTISEAGKVRAEALAVAGEAEKREEIKTKHQEALLRIDQKKEISQAIVDFTENLLDKLAEFIFNEDNGLVVKIPAATGAALEKVLDTLTTPIVAGAGIGVGVGGLVAGSFLVGEIATISPNLTIYLSAGISAIIGGGIGKIISKWLNEPSFKSALKSRLGRTELITTTP